MSSDRPRLLVLASTYPRWSGDPEPGFVHNLSRGLTSDFEVHVLCPHAAGALTEEELDGVEVHRFRYAPGKLESLVHGGGILNNLEHHPWKWLLLPFFFTGLTFKTWHLCRLLRPDCIHVHWIVPQGLALVLAQRFQKRPTPFLLTSHGGDLYSLRGKLLQWLKGILLRQAAAITVVSRAMVAEAVHLGAQPNKVQVIPMGADSAGLFTPGPAESRERGEILFVGRLVAKKGLSYLIEAMPMVLEHTPDAQLIIAGYGPEEPILRELTAHLCLEDKVSFLGAVQQSELPGLYRRASVFVAPFVKAGSGDQEGLPVALMEAIACGCPVIVGDLGVLDDIFQSEEADMRVVPSDVARLAKRVISVLENTDDAFRRAEGMRLRIAKHFDSASIARQYAELLRVIFSACQKG